MDFREHCPLGWCFFVFSLCTFVLNADSLSSKRKMKYLALGDSYTIGEAVPQSGSFPYQLAKGLEEKNIGNFSEVRVIAKTGWTTDELKAAIEAARPASDYDLVTLLIGVNNQYRGYPLAQFEKDFGDLLKSAISFAKGKPNHVLVVAIPDYGCTPFGAEKATQIERQLLDYNRVCSQIALYREVEFVDIFDVSKKAKSQPELVAEDQLHPSQKMYSLWVEEILPKAEKIVRML